MEALRPQKQGCRMKWRQVDDWHWERECGRYTVCRSLSFAKSKDGHWVYLAWQRAAKKGDVATCLSPQARDSLTAAIADCSAHLRASRARLDSHTTAANAA